MKTWTCYQVGGKEDYGMGNKIMEQERPGELQKWMAAKVNVH